MADLSLSYSCRDGDVLDEIIWRHYGDQADGKLEAVLAVNPGIAGLGSTLPAGQLIALPDLEDDTPTETAQLWG